MNPVNHKVKFIEGNGSPFRSIKPSRNDPCKCGSGKKAKNCHGAEAKFYYSKDIKKQNDATNSH